MPSWLCTGMVLLPEPPALFMLFLFLVLCSALFLTANHKHRALPVFLVGIFNGHIVLLIKFCMTNHRRVFSLPVVPHVLEELSGNALSVLSSDQARRSSWRRENSCRAAHGKILCLRKQIKEKPPGYFPIKQKLPWKWSAWVL